MIYIIIACGIVLFCAATAAVRCLTKKDIVKTEAKPGRFAYCVIYSDTRSGKAKANPGMLNTGKNLWREAYDTHTVMSFLLKSDRLSISGKPDLIYSNGKRLYPVELKSGSAGERDLPPEGDLMQLAAYFALIEEVFSVRAKTGRLIYSDCMFIVRNSRRLRKRLLITLAEMRHIYENGIENTVVDKSYPKCKNCLYRDVVCK